VTRLARARVALSLAVFSNWNGAFISVAILPVPITSRKPDQTIAYFIKITVERPTMNCDVSPLVVGLEPNKLEPWY